MPRDLQVDTPHCTARHPAALPRSAGAAPLTPRGARSSRRGSEPLGTIWPDKKPPAGEGVSRTALAGVDTRHVAGFGPVPSRGRGLTPLGSGPVLTAADPTSSPEFVSRSAERCGTWCYVTVRYVNMCRLSGRGGIRPPSPGFGRFGGTRNRGSDPADTRGTGGTARTRRYRAVRTLSGRYSARRDRNSGSPGSDGHTRGVSRCCPGVSPGVCATGGSGVCDGRGLRVTAAVQTAAGPAGQRERRSAASAAHTRVNGRCRCPAVRVHRRVRFCVCCHPLPSCKVGYCEGIEDHRDYILGLRKLSQEAK